MTENTTENIKGGEKNLMVSAYTDKHNKLVLVGTNYGTGAVKIRLNIRKPKQKYGQAIRYLTTASDEVNMKPESLKQYAQVISLPGRSISTIVID
jgi:O-glycosyl hydrolase